MANVKISELPSGIPSSTSIFPFVDGGTTYQGAISAITSNGGGVVDVTYSELVDKITGDTLSTETFYNITDFKTCYDQPDFDSYGGPIFDPNYKECSVEPIIVFATSTNTISTIAYQPTYPNDRIQYDWTFSATEITSGVAYGRISERIDEFGNRTDYDHRNIKFKRYRHISFDFGNPKVGTCNLEYLSDTQMTIVGTGTVFTELSVGDYVGFSNTGYMPYEIISIDSDTSMVVSGLTINTTTNTTLFLGELGNYDNYKQNNISTTDFTEYFTFDTDNGNYTMVNNYIGNLAETYVFAEASFKLSNNVFKSSSSYNNKLSDYCYNNTFGAGSQNNEIGYTSFNNIFVDDFYDNSIGNYFVRNVITYNFNNNKIGNGFSENYISGNNTFYNNSIMNGFYLNSIGGGNFENNEIGNQFEGNRIRRDFYKNDIGNNFNDNNIFNYFYGNLIANSFNDNIIYSQFYQNEIGEYFEGNNVSSFPDINRFEFYGNKISIYFNNNIIRQNFFYNSIGIDFNNNITNGGFGRNDIGDSFYENYNIGHEFYNNKIGNYFNQNDNIGDYFENNQIGNDFYDNYISYYFENNTIGNSFQNNTLGDTSFFTWDNTSIENLTGRTYNTFYNALNQEIGYIVLGKELIMHDTVNDEYHKVKFTQWTQGGNGGGFSYERTKVYPSVEPTVYFTKTNYGSEVDVIVPGSLEITRGDNHGIYNTATEGSSDNNVSPQGTEWNSIYTQPNNGNEFVVNKIGDLFKSNFILNPFGDNQIGAFVVANHFSGETYSNNIGSNTYSNDFLGRCESNTWGNSFRENTIGDDFRFNQINSNFYNNVIGNNFGFGFSSSQGNKIGNYFYNNTIGEYFYNNTIPDSFNNNIVSDYFQWNNIGTVVNSTTLTSCLFYSSTTVNVFTNNAGQLRLSYYDSSDILNVESFTDNVC